LITGFLGIGGAGYWIVRYSVQKLNAERVNHRVTVCSYFCNPKYYKFEVGSIYT